METAQKKGMSKGCLVALIVVGALIVIMLLGMATCWYYRNDLMKFAGTAAINQVKARVAEAPPEGIDTVQFNALVDAFVAKVNDQKDIDMQEYSQVLQTAQYVAGEKELDSALVKRLENSLATYLPELKALQKAPAPEEEENLQPEEPSEDE